MPTITPADYGYEEVSEKGPLTRYEKETDAGRYIVYQTPERAVRVNEAARTPNVVEASQSFFWREHIRSGSLYRNERVETVEKAHELAQELIEECLQ